MAEKEITIEFKNIELWVVLGFLVAVLFLDLQVTLNTPISFGDEGFHSRLAQYIGTNIEYPVYITNIEGTPLKAIGYNRPPAWNLLEAATFMVVGFNENIIRVLTPLIIFFTGLITYILVKRLFDGRTAVIAAIIAVTIPSLVTYSILFYTDSLFVFFSTLFFLTFLVYAKEKSNKFLILAAFFASLAVLTKTPGYAYYLVFILSFAYEMIKDRNLLTLKKYVPVILILLLIPGGFFIRNTVLYKNPICFSIPFYNPFPMDNCNINNWDSTYSFAGRTTGQGTESSVYDIGLMNYLDFAYGTLIFVVLSFVAGFFVLFSERKDLFKYLAVLFLILAITFYLTTGRAEDTARYTLAWVPLISMVSAVFFNKVYELFTSYYKYLGVIVFIIVIVLAYQNLKPKLDSMAQIKQFSSTFFVACDWVKNNTDQVPLDARLMTIWAHRAIYNCQRASSGSMADIMLSTDVNFTLRVTKANEITHLFIQKFSIDPQNQHLEENYDIDFVQFLENNADHFNKIYDDQAYCNLYNSAGVVIDQRLANNMDEALTYISNGYQCDGNAIYKIVY